MFRTVFGLVSAVILCAATGCTMCCHPYDHSGPVYEDGCQSGCQSSTHTRAGSILAGNSQPSPDSLDKSQIQDESISSVPAKKKTQAHLASFSTPNGRTQDQSTRQQAKPQPGYVPGSERILSVTDGVVKPAAEASQVAEATSSPSKPLPTTGWTARRPTTEVLR